MVPPLVVEKTWDGMQIQAPLYVNYSSIIEGLNRIDARKKSEPQIDRTKTVQVAADDRISLIYTLRIFSSA
ncbi:MAG: hypothetical protein A2136_05630 [Chloroflexi bacterium RBG_16_54_11]|nr:MAG: hypothetical protein A2136_05630 [Chloroflexi bacterium RBG_16_54_11]